MSKQIITALIAGVVALITAFITASVTGYSTYLQLRKEREKFITDFKMSYNLELYKARLKTYPKLLRILKRLSVRSSEKLNPVEAKDIAVEINNWLYSAGGLFAEKETRGAILGLRESCIRWEGEPPSSQLYSRLYKFRDATVTLLRRDLDLEGLESYDFDNISSLLEKITESINGVQRKQPNKLLQRRSRRMW